ncbi:hypothetical protein E2C01_081834 [Portunus trituberculatus]|uniref:Uncharacterized protein n=1 Tax=Portunus trituberculatus TaxID=210409 RepID=A0A5B7IXI3_PORTR|nr:hypothetical protein [Portunus trituberculatus]
MEKSSRGNSNGNILVTRRLKTEKSDGNVLGSLQGPVFLPDSQKTPTKTIKANRTEPKHEPRTLNPEP